MTRRPDMVLAVWIAAFQISGCDDPFERMIEQPRLDVWEPSGFLPGGIGTQPPPPGTVPRHVDILPRSVEQGLAGDGQPVSTIPIAIDADDLVSGYRRYRVLCAPCHGPGGHADTPIARDMSLRRPPSLVDDPVRSFPPGRVYRAIIDGYGLMPSYGARLGTRERWQVVAFVQALQLSQRVRLDELPPNVQRKFRDAMKRSSQ